MPVTVNKSTGERIARIVVIDDLTNVFPAAFMSGSLDVCFPYQASAYPQAVQCS